MDARTIERLCEWLIIWALCVFMVLPVWMAHKLKQWGDIDRL